MRKAISALAAALLLAGCAANSNEPVCVAWSDDCDPDTPEQKWEVTTHFEGDREAETKTRADGWRARPIGEQACRRVTTPWAPEAVTSVEVTRISSGDTTTVDCADVSS